MATNNPIPPGSESDTSRCEFSNNPPGSDDPRLNNSESNQETACLESFTPNEYIIVQDDLNHPKDNK